MPSTNSPDDDPLCPRAFPAARKDRALLLLLCIALAALLAHAHAVNIDQNSKNDKIIWHEQTLENKAKDPYQYKFFVVTWAVEGVHRALGAPVYELYLINAFLSICALLLAHQIWIGRLYGPRTGMAGTLLLAALCHAYFLGYLHHPSDLWGVAGFCLLISGAGRGAPLARLCALALATGLVWEKHVLLPFLWAWSQWKGGVPWRRVIPRAALFLACALAVPIAIRIYCGTDRPTVDVTTLADQDWGKAAAHHLPLIIPFLVVLIAVGKDVPPWVRLLWLHVPALSLAYVLQHLMIDETRSFWAFAPVFTATACAWWRRLDSPAGTG